MSVAPLEVVKGMELTPNACVLCGSNPVDDVTGEQQPAVFAPGVDVDWGGSVYICWECCNIIADLCGRVTVDGFDALNGKYEKLKDAYEILVEEHNKAKGFIERIRDGQAALKEVKGGSKPTTKKKKAVKASG